MYTLILTVVLASGGAMYSNGAGTAIHHIDGFSTQDGCKEAGKLWLQTVSSSEPRQLRKSAICVLKGVSNVQTN